MRAEGWYRDPYALHTDRWFSDGRPTDLVRDDGQVSRDPPPAVPYSEPLVEAETAEPTDGDDMRRADDEADGSAYDPEGAAEAAMDAAAQPNNSVTWPHQRWRR
jgi:hypothetical protein